MHHELKQEVLEIMAKDPSRARRSYRYRPGKLYVSVPGYRVYFRESDTKSGEYESFEFVRLVAHPKSEYLLKTVKTIITLPFFLVLYLTNAVDFYLFSRHGRQKAQTKILDFCKSFLDGRFWERFLNMRPSSLLTLVLLLLVIVFAGYTYSAGSQRGRRAFSKELVARFLGVDPSKVRVLDDGTFVVDGERRTAGDRTIEPVEVMFKPGQYLRMADMPVLIRRHNVGSDGKAYPPTNVAVSKGKNGLYTVNKNDEIVFDARKAGRDFLYEPVRIPNSDADYASDVSRVGKIEGATVSTEVKTGVIVTDIERGK
jgi:cbb3-type cytochrome oxidase subunit 3